MDYAHITQFLERFKKILTEGRASHETIALLVSKHSNVELQPSQITTKGTIVYVQGSPLLRNEILFHKQEILDELKETLPGRHFTDIR